MREMTPTATRRRSPNTRIKRGLAAGGALAAVTLLATGCLGLNTPNVDIPQGVPPGAGAAVPYLHINAPGRTADQLADWARPISAGTGIPLLAMEAYGNAAEIQRQQHPECGITWTTIAGIGSVESKNGTYHGAEIAADGHVSPPIRGVPLDGTGGNMSISASDGTTPAQAMGPFQFIPETWQRFGVDANGDGKADPDNIDDAALTAARYLCVSGGDLTSATGWVRAVRIYNNSDAYVREVASRANAFSVGVAY